MLLLLLLLYLSHIVHLQLYIRENNVSAI